MKPGRFSKPPYPFRKSGPSIPPPSRHFYLKEKLSSEKSSALREHSRTNESENFIRRDSSKATLDEYLEQHASLAGGLGDSSDSYSSVNENKGRLGTSEVAL